MLLLGAGILFLSCNRSPDNQNRIGSTASVVIKGAIGPASAAKKVAQGESGPTLADAKSVLIFSGSYYTLATIANGAFTAYADAGTATALVFLDANNRYIGHLCAGGLNMLPLANLKNGDSTVIDLSTLTLDGDSVLPAHDPLGDEIGLNADEIAIYKQISGYYKALAKNIDADNNGIPDILGQTDIGINTVYSIAMGRWGLNDSAPQPVAASNYSVNYTVRIVGDKALKSLCDSSMTLSGPQDSASSDIAGKGYVFGPDCFIAGFQRDSQPAYSGRWLPFKDGIYTLTLQGTHAYTLSYSGINAQYYMLLAMPTLHTDSAGRVVSISFSYELPDNTPVANPENFLTAIQANFWDSSGAQIYGAGTLYDRVNLASNLSAISGFTPASPLDISKLEYVMVCYTDLLGNEYDCEWR